MKKKLKEELKDNKKNASRKIVNIRERGITLIALVITIIILLILAGVALNAAIGENGLFQRARLATEKYQKAEANETASLSQFEKEIKNAYIDYNEYVGTYVEGYSPETNSVGCTIEGGASGTGEAQIIKQETMKWQIWDYDNAKGIVRLISNKPTDDTLRLKNVNGYNNGVWAVNEVCRKLYSNNEKGVSVANLKRSDIQKVMKYDYTKYSHDNNSTEDKKENGKYKYGNVKTYNGNYKYPEMWEKDQLWSYYKKGDTTTSVSDTGDSIKTDGDDINSQKEGLIWELENNANGNLTGERTGSSSTGFKQSCWRHDWNATTAEEKDWVNPEYYNLIFGKDSRFEKNCWLACRYVFLNDDLCGFGLQYVHAFSDNCSVSGYNVYQSDRNSS